MSVANDNYTAVAPGQGFYPEMGERHDGTALFVSQIGRGGYYLKWEASRHPEALAAFKALKIKPRHMSDYVTTKGETKWSCGVTWAAGDKVLKSKYAVLTMLLD